MVTKMLCVYISVTVPDGPIITINDRQELITFFGHYDL